MRVFIRLAIVCQREQRLSVVQPPRGFFTLRMIFREFVIPLDKDELARTHFGEYGHREVVPLQMVSREINGECVVFSEKFNILGSTALFAIFVSGSCTFLE